MSARPSVVAIGLRTGTPMVTDVVRTRADAFRALHDGEERSDADIVMWVNRPLEDKFSPLERGVS